MGNAVVVVRLEPDAVSWREVDGEIVALDRRSGDYLAVNPTGVTLWTLLVHGATEAQMVEQLVADHGIDRARAERDVAAFVAALEARELVVRDAAS